MKMSAETMRANLTEAAHLVEGVLVTLDAYSTQCGSCQMVKARNLEERQIANEMEAVRAKILKFRERLERAAVRDHSVTEMGLKVQQASTNRELSDKIDAFVEEQFDPSSDVTHTSQAGRERLIKAVLSTVGVAV